MLNRIVPCPIYPRLLGYAVSLTMHLVNVDHMVNNFTGDELKNADVRRFHDDQLKFLTVWNVYAQMFYAALGLSCDIFALANKEKDSSVLKSLKKIRDFIFSSMICPISLTVSFVFWTVVSYDRSLILPPRVDQTIGWTSNHVIHTAIVPVVLWEIAFRPRRGPESHVLNLVLVYSYATGYLAVIVTSYLNNGTWIYPILNLLNGTVYLYIFLGISVIVVQAFYCLQWYLTHFVWGTREDIKKVN